jgi:hypothetical protein
MMMVSCAAQTPPPARAQADTQYATSTARITTKALPTSGPYGCDAIENKTCVIYIDASFASGSCTASMTSYVQLGTLTDINRVEWRLRSAGYEFCARGGDGAFFIAPDSEPFDPDPPGKCGTTFGMKRRDIDGKDYGYNVRFRNRTLGIVCEKDPYFKNG